MSAAIARPITQEVSEEMREYVLVAEEYLRDDDEMARAWDAQIDRALIARTAEAHVCYAQLAELKGDLEGVERHLDRAVQNGCDPVTATQNRFVSYTNLLYATKAIGVAAGAVDIRQQNIGVGLVGVLATGALSHARTLVQQARAAQLDPETIMQYSAVCEVLEGMEMHARVSDTVFARVIDAAGEVLRARRLFWLERSPRIGFDAGTGCMSVRYKVAATAEEAAQMTLETADLMIERELYSAPITVGFIGVKGR